MHLKCALQKPLNYDTDDSSDEFDGFDERLNKLTRDKDKRYRKW